MEYHEPSRTIATASSIIFLIVFLGTNASAVIKERSYAFHGTDGDGYLTGLTVDASGNLWGISPFYGAYGFGNVFELIHDANGQLKETVLYSFTNGKDGGIPSGGEGPTLDAEGNLYGVTTQGGAFNAGTVFKLAHTSSGWKISILWNFTCRDDGCSPNSGLIFDGAGNLYGTTWGGGPGGSGYGTVYRLSPRSSGGWKETTLHSFSGRGDGAGSLAPVIFDAHGNLYGTTSAGGANTRCDNGNFFGCGVVFKLTHNVRGGWTEDVVYNFSGGSDGAYPAGRVAFDSSGNLYGSTAYAGSVACFCGIVFSLAPTSLSGQWTFSVLHTFNGESDGSSPYEGVILDSAGNIYGTAFSGGSGSCLPYQGCGTVFRLVPDQRGGWTFELLYSFLGTSDGGLAFGVVLDESSELYGTTGTGGYLGGECASSGCGTIFELTANPK
jgi:uncharacterized repeat protein (TIGR03803 family)